MRNKIITGLVALTMVSGVVPAMAQNGDRYAQNTAPAGQRQNGDGPIAKMLASVEGDLHLDRTQRAVWQDYRNALLQAQPRRPDANGSNAPTRSDNRDTQAQRPHAADGQRPLLAEMLAEGPLQGTPQAAELKRAARSIRTSLSPEQIDRLTKAEASMPKPPHGGRPAHANNG
ncbi:hypothetical protein [Paracoccus sp. JM45]|uniref:hypothetical protein n=1 Tax=Paracoccus sp. JM45 TaxID=2283626 RepID=UPI000E6B6388|nr:hypothetical protein [Paracoccus sp. JM45]RJE79191.1 hypothetical protein DWB67_13380 [Paracoccus sp. JM45]